MTHDIVPATLEHALQLAPRLRKGDRQEIAASSGGDPENILVLSLAMSGNTAWTYLRNGKVMAMFGAAPHPGQQGVGIPWLLAAPGAQKNKTYFLKRSRQYIAALFEEFHYLENWVDCRNTVSIQWLSWLGFALAEVNPYFGVQRLPFIRFMQARRTQPSVNP